MLFTLLAFSALGVDAVPALPPCASKDPLFEGARVMVAPRTGWVMTQVVWASGGSMGNYQWATLLIEPTTCAYVGLVWSGTAGSFNGAVGVITNGPAVTPAELDVLLAAMKLARAEETDARDEVLLGFKGWRPGRLQRQRSSVVHEPESTAASDELGCLAPLKGRCECPCFRGSRAGEKMKLKATRRLGTLQISTFADDARLLFQHRLTGIEDTTGKPRHLWLDLHAVDHGAQRIGDSVWWWQPNYEEGDEVLALNLKTATVERFALKRPGRSCDDDDERLEVNRIEARGVWASIALPLGDEPATPNKPIFLGWSAVRSPAPCVESQPPP